jgi:hypothetical protein
LLTNVEQRRCPRYLTELSLIRDTVRPPSPHRLEAGASETWAISAFEVQAFADTNKDVFKLSAALITAKVELGARPTSSSGVCRVGSGSPMAT